MLTCNRGILIELLSDTNALYFSFSSATSGLQVADKTPLAMSNLLSTTHKCQGK